MTIQDLPAVNASLNFIATCLLLAGVALLFARWRHREVRACRPQRRRRHPPRAVRIGHHFAARPLVRRGRVQRCDEALVGRGLCRSRHRHVHRRRLWVAAVDLLIVGGQEPCQVLIDLQRVGRIHRPFNQK